MNSNITSLKEQSIKHRTGSEILIGSYGEDSNTGQAYFSDIRGEDGAVVDRTLIEKDVRISYDGPKLEIDTFYQFHWHMDANGDIVIDGKVEKIDRVRFLNKLFDVYATMQGKALTDAANNQNTILKEVTGAEHTYIYELLQNANDYPYPGEEDDVKVKFIVTDHYLFFLHTGSNFNLRNIEGICSFNEGEKRDNVETIGYKGIGFKTVFVKNDYVYLHSGDWNLRFDQKYSEVRKFGSCPWTIMPIPTSDADLDEEVRNVLRQVPPHYRVQFALRNKDHNAEVNIPQLEKVFSDNQILLFIPHVCEAVVSKGGKVLYDVKKDREHWEVEQYKYRVPDDLHEWVSRDINSGSRIPDKFKHIKTVGISFAVGKDGNKLAPVENARVYNYLPTELHLGFNFLINADFIPNSSRSGLHEDVLWNDRIMEECGRMFVKWWCSFLEDETKWDMTSVFQLIPDFGSHEHFTQKFFDGFQEEVLQSECIPTKRREYKLCKLSDIVVDELGLTGEGNSLFTDDEFYEFSGTEKSLPYLSIRDDEKVNDLLTELLPGECDVWGYGDFVFMCQNSKFQEWLKVKENNIRFLKYAIEQSLMSGISNYPIFLSSHGELCSADKLYLDVDKYMGDLYFLDNIIERLDTEVGDELSQLRGWSDIKSKFVTFSPYQFAKQQILGRYHRIKDAFSEKKENVHLTHFLAMSGISSGALPQDYALYLQNSEKRTFAHRVYLQNDFADDLKSRSWFDSSWIEYIDNDYFVNDGEDVRKLLCGRGLEVLDFDKTYREFILNTEKMPLIASNIQDRNANIDFYRYLARNFNPMTLKFSKQMRENYVLYATDGQTEECLTISETIYFANEDWEDAMNASWMPHGLCMSISQGYFDGLSEDDSEKLHDFFASTSTNLVKNFTIGEWCAIIKYEKNFTRICSCITDIESSKSFLSFLFENRKRIFRDEVPDNSFRNIPILWEDDESLHSVSEYDSDGYFHNDELDELNNMAWLAAGSLPVCVHFYDDLFETTEAREFFKRIGIRPFRAVNYLRENVLNNIEAFKDVLSEKANNISFHKYFSSIQNKLTPEDYALLKEAPIFISSPSDDKGVVAAKSTDHYMPSDLLTDIIAKDLVPIDILGSILPEYIESKDDLSYYYITGLGNVTIDLSEFIDYISMNAEDIEEYLEDKDRNVRFWRWACDNGALADDKKKLSAFPIFGISGQEEEKLCKPEDLYASEVYVKINGLEQFVKTFVNEPIFISPIYNEEGKERIWTILFHAVHIVFDFKEIIFSEVIPHLEKYPQIDIIPQIARYISEIEPKLRDNDNNKTKEHFSRLQFLCADGNYRKPAEAIATGAYFDLEEDPLPEVVINNLISEEYLGDENTDVEEVRNIKRLIVAVEDCFKGKCDSLTKLHNLKINYFIKNQQRYTDETHYAIIAQLAKSYSYDREGIRDVLMKQDEELCLFDVNNKLIIANKLFYSSAYNLDCDFMGHGITNLPFVSEKYLDYAEKKIITEFFKSLHIRYQFNSDLLSLLENEQFAYYFWTDYASQRDYILKYICTEDNLRQISCIPTANGVQKPSELYDYRDEQLQRIVLRLANGKEKLPCIELPEWMGNTRIGFRSHLYLPDCLEYLNLNTNDYRRDVMRWIAKTPDETLQRYAFKINEYRAQALWFNGEKEWKPLSSLVALEWGNDTLRGNFSSNPFVCNPSYMPDSKEEFNKICYLFGIKIIKDADFHKEKRDYKEDLAAKSEFKKRLLYLAYKSGDDDWEDTYKEKTQQLDACDISTCGSIDYIYDEHIHTGLRSYTDDDSKLWYVGAWNQSMFGKVLNWLIRVFDISGVDDSYLENLFLTDFHNFLEHHEHDLSPDFFKYLSEEEKQGLREDTEARPEEFDESKDDDQKAASLVDEVKSVYQDQSSVPQSIVTSNDTDDDSLPNYNNVNSHSADSPDAAVDESSAPSGEESTSEPPKRQRRSDYGSTHDYPLSRDNSKYENQNDYEEDESSQERDLQSTQEDDTLENKLQKKWNKEASREIGRPVSHKSYFGDESEQDFDDGRLPDGPQSASTFFGDSNGSEYGYNSKGKSTNEQLKRKKTTAANQAEDAEEQFEIGELLNVTPKYSFLWFKYYMELLYADRTNVSTRKVKIDFMQSELQKENTILHLSAPSMVVPDWIENAGKLVLTAYKNKVCKKLKADIVSMDNLNVNIQIEDDQELIDFCKDANLFRLSAEDSSNIIDSLRRRFLQLNYANDFDMQANLPANIEFIYGPPGTGKTTRLKDRIHSIIEETQGNMNILVLTPTNKAVDVIAKKLADDNVCYGFLNRFGTTEDPDLVDYYAVHVDRDTLDMSENQKNIVVTTVARYSYDYLQPDDTYLCDFPWDYIIVDEASMIGLVPIVYILYKGMDAKIIIAGDPKQIQPIKQNDLDVENIYQMIGMDSLRNVIFNFKRFPVESLLTQYRSIPVIGDLVSQFAYDGLVKSYEQRTPQKQLILDGIPTKAINFVGFPTLEFDSLYELTAINGSAFHLYSAIFTYNMAGYVAKQIAQKYPKDSYSIGIVCPYKAEADAIKQMVEEKDISQPNCQISCGTVHSFQGDECDIMFVVLNPPAQVTFGTHVNNQNIVNVALSRARDYLFILMPSENMKGFTIKNTLGRLASHDNRTIQFCQDIEEVMFGSKDYIFNNTNVTCHMPVNVYYDSHSKYEVRINDTALDIELN